MRAHIGVRINPDVSYRGNGGKANKFGIDEAAFLKTLPGLKKLPNILIVGVHTHIGSQVLDWRTI